MAESTANAYVRTLYTLNEKKPYKNLSFLKDVPAITARMEKYADSTKDSVLGAISSVLSLFSGKPSMAKLYKEYHEMYAAKSKEVKAVRETNEKSEKQKENWIPWEDVLKRRGELAETVGGFKKTLSLSEYETLLQHLVLSLYTEIQPRRNQDYLDMFVVKKYNPATHNENNYYDLATKKMIFTRYKTAKKYGTQTQDVPESLQKVLEDYLKHHTQRAELKKNVGHIRLLVGKGGEAMDATNAITRLLNKAFGKKVGSSMLRHIYLSDKYKNTLTEMKEDAATMGHSLGLQKEYIKTDAPVAVPLIPTPAVPSSGPTLEIKEGEVIEPIPVPKKKRATRKAPRKETTEKTLPSLPASS